MINFKCVDNLNRHTVKVISIEQRQNRAGINPKPKTETETDYVDFCMMAGNILFVVEK